MFQTLYIKKNNPLIGEGARERENGKRGISAQASGERKVKEKAEEKGKSRERGEKEERRRNN